MSTPHSPRRRKTRSDGWTPERQLRFLDALARTQSVIKAAEFAAMSRESAYRLRDRRDGALFGLLWDRILAPELAAGESHNQPLTDGRLRRLLSTHFRRERGDYSNIGSARPARAKPDRTWPL